MQKNTIRAIEKKVIIIGSGFGGQCAAINLLRRGVDDFLILERRGEPGGTWVQNTYPGAAVDVQSPLYSFSFEPYRWSRMFAEQEELKQYTQHVLKKYGLNQKTVTDCNVDAVQWLAEAGRWQITTSQGTYRAKFVINASGPLSTPVIPKFPGQERFTGHSFHTNEWNHDYDYRAKRVAVIGSGASAAQVIPAIVDQVSQLHVFMRTPHWVLRRSDRQFGPLTRALLGIRPIYKLLRTIIYWALEFRVVGMKYSLGGLKIFAQGAALKQLKQQVPNPTLRRKLTPDYLIGCKRIILSNTLLPALGRDNTTLYTKGEGIAKINRRGIVTQDGRQVEVDLIIYATGFDATDGVISYPVTGMNQTALSEVWSDYPRAYMGTTIPGFPNFFIVTGPNTGIGHTSAIFIIESQMNYIMDSILTVEKKMAATIEVNARAERDYTNHIHSEMEGTVWHSGGCNSWYKSKSGKVIAMFPGFSFMFRLMTRRMRQTDHTLLAQLPDVESSAVHSKAQARA